jgi:hypothetical protein
LLHAGLDVLTVRGTPLQSALHKTIQKNTFMFQDGNEKKIKMRVTVKLAQG